MKTASSQLPGTRLAGLTPVLERWFQHEQRDLPWRRSYDAYAVWVSEVMLQQTRVDVVVPYFERFIQRLPDVRSLAEASEDLVLGLWSGLGYYRRARMLRTGAGHVIEHFGGTLPRSVDELLRIPGVGRYTAGAIASIAFDLPIPIVDGNVARVLARIEAMDEPFASRNLSARQWRLSEMLVGQAASPRALNQSLMELGALVCTPRDPRCDQCPIESMCLARRQGREQELPRRRPAGAVRELMIPLYVVRDHRGHILMRKESGPLMNGLFHLPHGNGLLLSDDSASFTSGPLLGSIRHTITNRRIRFDVYAAEPVANRVKDSAGDCWVDPLRVDVAHPSYVRKALALLR